MCKKLKNKNLLCDLSFYKDIFKPKEIIEIKDIKFDKDYVLANIFYHKMAK